MRAPLIADIRRNALDDGPGIRSTVFFKGCPLACVWCHNPECIGPAAELMFSADRCLGCLECAAVCPERAVTAKDGAPVRDRERCRTCGTCADACPGGAVEVVGRRLEAAELVAELLRDEAFYRSSGGGVTLSGGEPTLYAEYAGGVAAALHARGVHVLLETCGHFEWERFERHLRPHLDAVYCDLKILDPERHRRFTGRVNTWIVENLERLLADPRGLEVLVRVPLVPGVTATPEDLCATRRWLEARGVRRIALLPYNPLWTSKATGLGRAVAYDRRTWMTADEKQEVRRIFDGFDVEGLG